SIQAAKPAAPPPGTAASEIGPQRNLLIAACAALLVVALAVGIWWKLHRSSDAPKATEPVTTAAVPPQSQPTPALAVPEPPPKPETKPESDSISSVPAPPPPTPVVPLPGPSKALAPPVVAAAPTPKAKTPALPLTPGNPASSAAAPVARAPQGDVVEAKLTDGLPFRIALEGDVGTSVDVGQPLHFRVLDGLEVNGVTVIAKGSMVTGSVAALA